MLELQELLWVLPGVIFIHVYNKKRPADNINLSGWSYIFSLVVIATITWLPFKIWLSEKYFGEWKILYVTFLSVILSFCLTLFLIQPKIFLFIKNSNSFVINIFKYIFPREIYDNFIVNCIKWERKTIILSLKNNKAYIGILLKYPENPKSKYETQMISIRPLISGGRGQHTKQIDWKVYYPQIEEDSFEMMIPRSEIITFGKFNKDVFKHFHNDNHNIKDT